MRRITACIVAALVGAALLVGLTPDPSAAATTIQVTTNLDLSNPDDVFISFREALALAASDGEPSVVELPAGAAIGLTNCSPSGGDLGYAIDQALTIKGNGATVNQLCDGERVMTLATPNQPIVVQDLTIAGGSVSGVDGAGLWANAPLTLNGVRFVDNHATGMNGTGLGGGLRALKSTFITNTDFTGNSSANGGAAYVTANVQLIRSAVVGNEAGLTGGLSASGGTVTLVSSVVTGNTSLAHGTGGVSGSDIVLRNATVANNTGTMFTRRQLSAIGNLTSVRSVIADPGAGTSNCAIGGSTSSTGFNYASDSTCGFSTATGDLPLAGPVGFEVATTAQYSTTARPPADSVLVDAVPPGNCDNTYVNDLFQAPRPQGAGCEVGAIEIAPVVPPVPATCDGQQVTVDLSKGESPTTGADVILGTPGNDTVDALAGNDRFCGQGGADTFNGGPGNDRAFGGRGRDVLRGNGGNDLLEGGIGDDRLLGQIARDILRGGQGRDVADGGPGNDAVNGGAQRDTCRGGAGTDTRTACEVRIGFP